MAELWQVPPVVRWGTLLVGWGHLKTGFSMYSPALFRASRQRVWPPLYQRSPVHIAFCNSQKSESNWKYFQLEEIEVPELKFDVSDFAPR
jgi:hypothetical protein